MGPEGGEFGGRVIGHGTPEQLASVAASHTGHFLRPHFPGLKSIKSANPNAGPQQIVSTPDPVKPAKAKFIAPEKKTGRPTAQARRQKVAMELPRPPPNSASPNTPRLRHRVPGASPIFSTSPFSSRSPLPASSSASYFSSPFTLTTPRPPSLTSASSSSSTSPPTHRPGSGLVYLPLPLAALIRLRHLVEPSRRQPPPHPCRRSPWPLYLGSLNPPPRPQKPLPSKRSLLPQASSGPLLSSGPSSHHSSKRSSFGVSFFPGLAIVIDYLRLPKSLDALDVWQAGETFSRPALVASTILTSLLFGGVHAAQLGFAWPNVALLAAVSLILCLVRIRTGSTAASTLLHASYNFSIFLGLFIITGGFRHMDKL